ncbi:NBS-LRR type disease resistance protein [Melia azedarach]|uniref:NBS-LRR type disease resistance protein n=1 Tax=Melia azedarach TaxID=155640 RepID=A0ACC1Y703_MELAZ|nr:NBS-LRR type disease resistance protein [Melia azedarach]
MGNIFAISIPTDQILSCFQDCTVKKATYICQLEDNLDSLKTSLQDLIQAKNDLMTRILIAEQQQMKRLNKVQLWLTRVDYAEIEVGELQKAGTKEIQNLCVGSCCSKNLKSSLQVGAKSSQKAATRRFLESSRS